MESSKHISGDLSVGRNTNIGGSADIQGNATIGHNLKVKGWVEAPNIKDINKGVFTTSAALNSAYPNPKVGWVAGVLGVKDEGLETEENVVFLYMAVGGEWVKQEGYDMVFNYDLEQPLEELYQTFETQISHIIKELNDFSYLTPESVTYKDGYALNSDGNEVVSGSWKCTSDFLEIPTPEANDVIVWGGINNSSYCICFYDAGKNLIDAYSAVVSEPNTRTIVLSDSSLVVTQSAKFCRASFLINNTALLTYNGTNLLVEDARKVILDTTLNEHLPADAKSVGEEFGIRFIKNGYVKSDGTIQDSNTWCHAECVLDTPIKANDIIIWNGIETYTNAKLVFLDDNNSVVSDWSAYIEGGGHARTITISSSSAAIGSIKIKASFLLSFKDSASISVNGSVIPFTRSNRFDELESTINNFIASTSVLNADKQPIVVSLSRVKPSANTLKKYFCFAHITDTHNENFLVKRAVDFVNSDFFKNSIDCLVHTGDIQFYQFNEGDTEEYHNAMDNSVKPAFTILGNHDVYTSNSLESLYNRYMKPMVDKGLLIAGENIDDENYATWYYYDFADYKIRLIALNDFDPLWNGYTKPLNTTAYSPEQITFLINTLQSVPGDYTVIIADHFAPNRGDGYTGTLINNGWTIGTGEIGTGHNSVFEGNVSPVIDILGAYKVKGTLEKTYEYADSYIQEHYGGISVDVDFSNANGELSFMACGHTHNDEIMKFTSHNNIIAISLLGGINPTKIDSSTNIMRDYAGKSQDAINVYCVRTDEKKVYIIRIGADFKNDGTPQFITSFSY